MSSDVSIAVKEDTSIRNAQNRKWNAIVGGRLSHNESSCFRRTKKQLKSGTRPGNDKSQVILNCSSSNHTNACYFINCVINGEPLKGYVDSGCAAVTIRDSDVDKLSLKRLPTSMRLNGFSGGSVLVKSRVKIDLHVDMASSLVEALVVPNEFQEVSVTVGQPFINNEKISVLIQGDQVRLFNNLTQLDYVPDLPPRKVNLWAKETAVIPPNNIEHIEV